jgi:hypothetical protein
VEHFTLSKAYESADSIIVGLISECSEQVSSDPYASGGDDCSFISLEVLKESVPSHDYSGVASSSGCGLSLHVGSQYLLFLDSKKRPMYPSASLSGHHYGTQQIGQYVSILRDYRRGRVKDLAEPWMYEESQGYCFIKQRIKGHQIVFSRRMHDAPPEPKPEWLEETLNGETVYRATVPLVDVDTNIAVGDAEIVAFDDIPDYENDALLLSVSLQDTTPATVRQTTFSVGNRTWALNRMETNLALLPGDSIHKVVEYWASGEVAEQILSAMGQPSEIVVSATIVPANDASEIHEIPQPDAPFVDKALSTGDFVVQSPPRSGSTSPTAELDVRAAERYRGQEEPAEANLRLESRSTHLSDVIKGFHACYEGRRQ